MKVNNTAARLFTLFLSFLFHQATAQAGDINAVSIDHPNPTVMITVCAGIKNPTSDLKQKAFAGKSTGFSGGIFVAILKGSKYSFGFNAEGEYFSGSSDAQFNTLPDPFMVRGASSVTVNQRSSADEKTSSSILGVAPQVNFFIGRHFIFSPLFEVGYLKVTGQSFTASQTTILDQNQTDHFLISRNVEISRGLAMIPKIRMSYMFSQSIGMWLEASYMLGPNTETTVTTFTPEPEPDNNGEYDIAQLDNGTTETEHTTTNFNTIDFNIGIVFVFGGGHHVPKIKPVAVVPEEVQPDENNEEQVCQNLKVEIKKVADSNPILYRLSITNNYMGTNLKYKPKSFNIKIKDNKLSKIEESVSAGLSRTPSKIPPTIKDVSWNSPSFISQGETDLGKLQFESSGTKQFTVVYEWKNKSQNTICKDSISFNDSKYYYDLNRQVNNHTEIFDPVLNLQFSNEYATSANLDLKIYDIKTKKLVRRKSDKGLSVTSLNGVNRISIDLKEYQLTPGSPYVLIVSNSNIKYNFNFKLNDKAINNREK